MKYQIVYYGRPFGEVTASNELEAREYGAKRFGLWLEAVEARRVTDDG